MALTLQEISDRMEIQDLLYEYADIIDRKRFDDLRQVFTADAHIDYSVYGGAVGDLETIITYLKGALKAFPNSHHLNANMQIRVGGDTATGKIMCFNPMEMAQGEASHTFLLGLWYHDRYRRTADGWRISERVEEKCWQMGFPG